MIDKAFERRFEQTYGRLRALGQGIINAHGGHSITGTELVHEVLLRLPPAPLRFENDNHFFAWVAVVMRSHLTDRVRAKSADKRRPRADAFAPSATFDEHAELTDQLDALEAIEALADAAPTEGLVVRLEALGLGRRRIAEVLGVSEHTVRQLREHGLAFVRAAMKEKDDEAKRRPQGDERPA